MKKITLLGSTGSIGRNTLDVIRHLKDEFVVTALAALNNIELLAEQIEEFKPDAVAVADERKARELAERFSDLLIYSGKEGVATLASEKVDLVVAAISGTSGIQPVAKAISAGNDVALANKEVLVSAGALITAMAKEKGCRIVPIDSEHSAIFQCMEGHRESAIRRLILTASGGPFRLTPYEEMSAITLERALNHPTWSMGAKNSIDSSTLMNKGLEVIEAHWLFAIPPEQIEVFIHPESIVHAFVEFKDHSTLAQVSHPDMRLPIQYALTYPQRLPSLQQPLDIMKLSTLQFYPPDMRRFPCLKFAYESLQQGKSYCCYLNAANEQLVNAFIKGAIHWLDITHSLDKLLQKHQPQELSTLGDVLSIDRQARLDVDALIENPKFLACLLH